MTLDGIQARPDGKQARPDVAGETGMPFETFPDAAPQTAGPAPKGRVRRPGAHSGHGLPARFGRYREGAGVTGDLTAVMPA